MQATFEQYRSYETPNQTWHNSQMATQALASPYMPRSFNSFSSFNSPFNVAPSRPMNAPAASFGFKQPAVYPQTPRGMNSSFNPYGSSALPAGFGRGGMMQPASMTNYTKEVVRTPDGGRMSRTSFTQVQQPASQHNRAPDMNGRDTSRRGYDQRCWNNKSNQASHEAMSVTSKGDDLKVNMGKNTTLETKKSDSDLFVNTQAGNDQIAFKSKGDPHFEATINGKEVLKGDYKDDLGLNINGTRYLMSPEAVKNNNGPAPYLSSTYVQQCDGSLYKLDHLSQADKTSKPTYSEVTDAAEKAAVNSKMNSAHTLTYDNHGGFIDSATGKKATNEDINKH
jgi:hypothetical protein